MIITGWTPKLWTPRPVTERTIVCVSPSSAELIEQNWKWAGSIARAMHNRGTGFLAEVDEMIGYSALGLIEAAKVYDPVKNNNFRAFARQRVHGAIIDGLRRQKVLLRQEAMRRGHKNPINLSLSTPLDDNGSELGQTLSSEVHSEDRMMLSMDVTIAFRPLNPQERAVVEARFWHGKTADEIAVDMDISSAAVTRIMAAAMVKMRRELL